MQKFASCTAKACGSLKQQVMRKRRGSSGLPTKIVLVYKQARSGERRFLRSFCFKKKPFTLMALLFNLRKGHLNCTIGLPLAACHRESSADLQFEPVKIESNHATKAYIHHCSWLGYSLQGRHDFLLDSACAVSAWFV